MSTANTAKKEANSAPWNDWKVDSEFLAEVNKYCEKRKTTFTKLVDELISKVKVGINISGNVLVSSSRLYTCMKYLHVSIVA